MLRLVSKILVASSLLCLSVPVQAQEWNENLESKFSKTSYYKPQRQSASSKINRGNRAMNKRLRQKNVRRGAKMFIRIFKTENVLELWMKRGQRYTLVKTYDICKWSGKIGPKQRTGDKQAPEGFYQIRQGQMNPNSKYHLAFNLGYPNKYDRAFKRTGSYLMVHGDCKSIGCYAMTDPAIEEIYGLMQSAFQNGQTSIPVHAFPFRMTAANIDKHSNSRWTDFWWNLKQGYDVFEATLTPPESQACGKNYTFTPPPLNAPGISNPSWSCMMTGAASNTDANAMTSQIHTANAEVK